MSIIGSLLNVITESRFDDKAQKVIKGGLIDIAIRRVDHRPPHVHILEKGTNNTIYELEIKPESIKPPKTIDDMVWYKTEEFGIPKEKIKTNILKLLKKKPSKSSGYETNWEYIIYYWNSSNGKDPKSYIDID